MQLLSAFGGGLFIIPLGLTVAAIGFYKTAKKTNDNTYYFPSLLCALGAIGSSIWMITAI